MKYVCLYVCVYVCHLWLSCSFCSVYCVQYYDYHTQLCVPDKCLKCF